MILINRRLKIVVKLMQSRGFPIKLLKVLLSFLLLPEKKKKGSLLFNTCIHKDSTPFKFLAFCQVLSGALQLLESFVLDQNHFLYKLNVFQYISSDNQ